MALGTSSTFQREILTKNVIYGIVYFLKIILESSWNISETTPRSQNLCKSDLHNWDINKI